MNISYSDLKNMDDDDLLYEWKKYLWVVEESNKANIRIQEKNKK